MRLARVLNLRPAVFSWPWRRLGGELRDKIIAWLDRRRERTVRVALDADVLVRFIGAAAYSEARQLQRLAHDRVERRHWRDVALAVARKTGKRVGLDTATRMALEAKFMGCGGSAPPEITSHKIDPIDELKRRVEDGKSR